MRPEGRPELLELAPVIHGGDAAAGVLDFSTGISPLAPSPEIIDAARNADVARYPHADALPLRRALSRLHGWPAEGIVAGAGSVELIWAVARAFAGVGRAGAVVTPAFGEYERALRVSGSEVALIPTTTMTTPAFALSMVALERVLERTRIAVLFLCRPSNPCLGACAADLIAAASQRWPETLFVVDEAYQPLFDEVIALSPSENVLVLRSLTKVFALPGLRLGYLLAAPRVARIIQAALPPWNVSTPAQAAGVVAASLLPGALPSIRREVNAWRDLLRGELRSSGAEPQAAGGTFLLYHRTDAADFCRRLLARGVRVRHAASFGLPNHIRVGIRTPAENHELVKAWRAVSEVRAGG